MIGYWLAEALADAGVGGPVAVVVTRTVVDGADPAFAAPTKFIGRGYDQARAHALAQRYGWSVAPDGDTWRRVVPSPRPLEIVEMAVIRRLLGMGALVTAAAEAASRVVGRGRELRGAEAVVNKDFFAALLASQCDADRLVILTDVAAVQRNFGTPQATPLRRVDVSDLQTLQARAGSMGPKIEAAVTFVSATGNPAMIGALAQARDVLEGRAGPVVVAEHQPQARPAGGTRGW
jgi:carbamate kinase